ncbi:MAG: cysteine synthase family protein [Acidobacteriota bacterium]
MSEHRVYDRISEAVGDTPMVRLGASVEGFALEAFAKLEYLNPMGSVKDRIARFMVERAMAEGRLHPGGVVLEASSGNTAMGLAMMAVLNNLTCRMVVRRQTSPAKLDCLRALGVELVLVDGELPPEHPESYNRKARRLAEETGAYFPDQHNNRINNEAHYRTTGPEIWRQMEGRIDAFVGGIGTGGTVSGVGRYLKEQDPAVRIVAVDIEGSVFTDHFKHGREVTPKSSWVEGLGDEEVIGCPEFEWFDDMVQVSDAEAFHAARQLARQEAIFTGGSSGAVLCGLRRAAPGIARELGRPARIATLFADSGTRYLTTFYSDDWMRERGFL